MADDILQELAQYEVRAGRPYFNPAHLVQINPGPRGFAPYSILGEIDIKPMETVTVSAPIPPKARQHYKAQAQQNVPVYGSASAPTSGIYTGVEDHCG